MYVIQVCTAGPTDFEDFPEVCERSVRGALRLLPGATLGITACELAALQAAGVELRVLRAPADPPQALPLPADPDELPAEPVKKAPERRAKKKGKAPA